MSYYRNNRRNTHHKSYRNSSRKRLHNYNVFNILVLAMVFIAGFIYFIVFPKSEVSEYEKRELEKFPKYQFGSILNGSFTRQLSKHIDDAVPFRDKTKDLAANILYFSGLHAGDDTMIIPPVVDNNQSESGETLPPIETRAPKTSAPDGSETSPTTTKPEVTKPTFKEEGVAEGGIYIQKETVRVMELPGGTRTALERYASVVNLYKEYLGNDVNVYSLVAPTASEFYLPEDDLKKYGSQKDKMQIVKEKLSNSVKFIDVISALEPHTNEYIYARTDFHWMPLGGYYAAQEFAKVADVPFTDISQYTPKVIEDFLGAFRNYVPNSYMAVLTKNPDTFTYYEPPNMAKTTTEFYDQRYNFVKEGKFLVPSTGSNAYNTLIGGDGYVVKIKTNVKNGRHLLIVKDSYGNALAPFLTDSFETIHVVDYRYFELNVIDFAQEQKITDLVIGTGLWGATTPSKIDAINQLTLQ